MIEVLLIEGTLASKYMLETLSFRSDFSSFLSFIIIIDVSATSSSLTEYIGDYVSFDIMLTSDIFILILLGLK